MGFGIRRKKAQHESRGRTFEAVTKAGRGVSLKAALQSSSLGPGALGKGLGGGGPGPLGGSSLGWSLLASRGFLAQVGSHAAR